MADANINEINEAADNGTFLQAAFEVIVSNSKNNDTQNVTGIAVDGNGDPIQAVSGNLYVQYDLTLNEGYTEATLKNTNTVFMKAAQNGTIEGRPGDHTGIYAHNTYDVNKITDGNLVVNFPGKTLGLVTHKGERSDYTELVVGEKYKFAISNFFVVSSYSVGDMFTINGGLWKFTSSANIPAGAVYGELKKISSFTEGGLYAGTGYVLEIKRKAVDLDDVTTFRAFNSEWVTDTTTAAFCASVNADPEAVAGMAYLGELTCSDLPFNGNADAVVEIVDGEGTSGKVIHIVITSGNIAPYRWEYTYWNDGANVSGWVAFTTPHTFTNTTVSTWVADETYADFGYRASVALTGVTANSFAQVVFSVTDAMSGNYAPVAETYNGGIYLYSKVNTEITVPTIYVLN